MFSALIAIGILAIALGLLLGWAAIRFKVEGDPVADQVESLLPQTQCGQCEFPGCRPYAEAVAKGEASINKCAPGGEATMLALAEMLEVEPEEVDPEHDKSQEELIALIDEETCIGCTKCIQACPVDAIIGAAKLMHTVVKDDCTGCELCLPPCPVDCIDMVPTSQGLDAWRWPAPDRQPHSTETVHPS